MYRTDRWSIMLATGQVANRLGASIVGVGIDPAGGGGAARHRVPSATATATATGTHDHPHAHHVDDQHAHDDHVEQPARRRR